MDLNIQILDKVEEFLSSIPPKDSAKILAAITMMKSGSGMSVITRGISGTIRELKVKSYRILYFLHKRSLYFVVGFTKKSQKTPLHQINAAKQIQKLVIQN